MGIGREVASAYINVHGDLSDFRRDLDKAGPITEKAARKNAETFADVWGKNVQDRVSKKWEGIIGAMGSDKTSDWNRAFANFDSTGLDDAQRKIIDFANNMRQLGNITSEQYKEMKKAVVSQIGVMRDEEQAQKDLNKQTEEAIRLQNAMDEGARRAGEIRKKQYDDAISENDAYDARRAKTMEEAIKENERWARTLDGMRKNNAIRDMNDDFAKLAKTMKSADMKSFAKSFDTIYDARDRIDEVTAAMERQGRMSREQSDRMKKDINDYIDRINAEKIAEDDAAKEKSRITRMALDETRRLREEQDRYNSSLNGMRNNFHVKELQNDFANLAHSMNTNDWSHFQKGADYVEQMRGNIVRTASEMHAFGRMTDAEFGNILSNVNRVNGEFRQMEGTGSAMFTALRTGASRFSASMSSLFSASQGLREHLQGFAGLNVFGDMIEGGLEFIHNLDRIAVSASLTAMKVSSAMSVVGSSLAGVFVIADDLGKTLGGLSALLPAFATGLGFMAYVGMSALQGMAKKYKTEILKWKEDLLTALNVGLQPAMDRFSQVMLPTLKKNLNDVAAAEGRLFGAILDGITASNGPDKMNLMFKRMNDAMDKSHAGVKSFINAWSTLGLVGTKYFDRFAVWFNKLGASFDAFITKAEKSGQIDRWIEAGIKGFKDLGRTIDGTLGIFNAVADAARKAGNGGLSKFADKLQGIAATMQSDRFQKTLTMFISGLNIMVGKLGDAIYKLGPAFESIMPSINLALGYLGDSVATIIGYIGRILSNPAVQKGITDFTGGVAKALASLEPAVKPFADSVGNMLTLLGRIVQSVADIAGAFTIYLGPVIDDMSRQVQTLLTPLSTTAVDAIKSLQGPLKAFNDNIVTPLVAGIRDKLLPAVDNFIKAASPALQSILDHLGPVATAISGAAAGVVTFATALIPFITTLVNAATPAVTVLLDHINSTFSNLGTNVHSAATSSDWDTLGAAIDRISKKASEVKFPGLSLPVDFALRIDVAALTESKKALGFAVLFGDTVMADWLKNLAEFSKFIDTATQFLAMILNPKNIVSNIITLIGTDFAMKNEENGWLTDGLDGWWTGVKASAQVWFKEKFGFGSDPSQKDSPANITGGMGGAGGKGYGVMGKITEDMLGNTGDPKTTVTGPLEAIGQAINDGLSGINSVVGGLTGALGNIWNTFWDGFGTIVSNTWNNITSWVSTIAGQVGANIASFAATVSSNWNAFWSGVGDKVSQTWQFVTQWIGQQVGNIIGNIGNFIGTVSSNWNSFWSGVGQKVQATWDFVWQWISSRVGSIMGSIAGFIGQVGSTWSGLWNNVGQVASAAWNWITGTVSNGINTVVSWIGGLPGQITGAIGNTWGLLQGAGEAIMGGLRRGLEAAWGGVQSFVGTIADWIAQHKGPISYDKTLLVPAGQAIMYGLETSMRSSFVSVMDFVSQMADMMAGAFGASKMYIAGKDASKGLADGLLANKSTIAAAYSDLGSLAPTSLGHLSVTGTGAAGGADRSSGTGAVMAPGAVQVSVTTAATDPNIVASKVSDTIDDALARFSAL